jgi:signal transduction histidine kinase
MVNSMLDISRFEAGEMPLEFVPTDLETIARRAVQSVTGLALDTSLDISAPSAALELTCDPAVIQRVVVNLLSNAIKFTPPGESIRISLAREDERLRVEVVDSGPGIPAQYHERIFEKFGRVEARAKKVRSSTGLGLAFCRLAVEAHGGAIGVVSEEGQGCTFWFTLPTSPPLAAPAAESARLEVPVPVS